MWRVAGQAPDAAAMAQAVPGRAGLFVADGGGDWDMGGALTAGERLAGLLAA